jgi:hypothetical protein
VSTKRAVPRPVEKPEVGRWRIVDGEGKLLFAFQSEELARARWFSFSHSRASDRGGKLLKPDGTVADEV